MLKSLSLLLCLSAAGQLFAQSGSNLDARVEALLKRMTLEEKIGQMSQTGFPRIDRYAEAEVRAGRWGSFYNGGTVQDKLRMQEIAIKESRLGIPLLYGADIIHGMRTIWPIPIGQASTWDPDLIEKACRITGAEATSAGIHWTFSPMVDIARDPRWGRIAEGYGEDPFLGSAMTRATVLGYQGRLGADDSLAACAKHYVGYGAAEGGRDYNSTWIPENLLREVYLPPFKAAKDAGIVSYMSAFNAINGVPASANAFTLRQVLRKEWGFRGFVVSDYESVKELIAHGVAANEAEAAQKAIDAGVNMEMVSHTYWDNAKELVASGKLKMATIDQAVREILRVKFELGLFDGRALRPQTVIEAPTDATRALARKIAGESLILLKNTKDLLPLSGRGRIAVVGPLADAAEDQMGTWSAGEPKETITPLAALRSELGDRLVYAPGVKDASDSDRGGFGAAIEAARKADAIVLFVGETAWMSGEANSRAHLELPGAQNALIEELAKCGKPIVAVVMAGRPLTHGAVADKLDAILYSFHPGTMGGPAIADVLLGRISPSGKTPVSFPRSVGQIPIPYNHLATGRPHNDDDHFTTGYGDESTDPAYPFGFGLSYTQFAYSNIEIHPARASFDSTIKVTAQVENVGKREADEVVQLYIRRPVASIARPVRELKGFQRIHLGVGEKKTVGFKLSAGDLRFYNANMKLVNEAGPIEVWVGPNSADGVKSVFALTR